MLSKKSFAIGGQQFPAPLVCPTRCNVRDHVDSCKSDHGSSHLSYRGLQRRRQLEIALREIFVAAQFSTFSTASTHLGSRHISILGSVRDTPCHSKSMEKSLSATLANSHLQQNELFGQ